LVDVTKRHTFIKQKQNTLSHSFADPALSVSPQDVASSIEDSYRADGYYAYTDAQQQEGGAGNQSLRQRVGHEVGVDPVNNFTACIAILPNAPRAVHFKRCQRVTAVTTATATVGVAMHGRQFPSITPVDMPPLLSRMTVHLPIEEARENKRHERAARGAHEGECSAQVVERKSHQ
jgi:hypothetical protein